MQPDPRGNLRPSGRGGCQLESGTSLEVATEIVIAELDPGQRLERITNAATKESASLRSIARAPQGFGK